jgi:hypothetical protein
LSPHVPRGAESLEPRRLLSTFQVTTTADTGAGSFRQAILDANALTGPDEIRFDLGGGVKVIPVRTKLPDVTDALTIDGTPPAGADGPRWVEIQGPGPSPSPANNFDGLTLRANTTVRAVAVTHFAGRGVVFAEGGGRLEGCYVGVTPNATGTDTLANGNRGDGVAVNTTGVTIGGTDPAQRNVISANSGTGVNVGSGGGGAVIQGNLIGLAAGGVRAQGNGYGIQVASSDGVRIGGTAASSRNVISGNSSAGVSLRAGATDAVVQGNYIGTDASGAAAIPNGLSSQRTGVGIEVMAGARVTVGGDTAAARNVISANYNAGISVDHAFEVRIGGNYIGTNAAGTDRLGAQRYGVRVAGPAGVELGPTPAERNVISGNGASGVLLEGTNLSHDFIYITYNYVGTNAAGDAAVPNGWDQAAPFHDGITLTVTGGASIFIGGQQRLGSVTNVISGNVGAGVHTLNSGAEIRDNYIGTNAAGNAAVGNGEGLVLDPGGYADHNVISGNAGAGVRIANAHFGPVVLVGNFVGTDAAGSVAVPNRGNGVEMIESQAYVTGFVPATAARAPNVISGNLGHGVLIVARPVPGQSNNSGVAGNYIGTDATGTRPLGNGGSGVYVAASDVSVVDNVIGANRGNGVTIADYPGMPTSRSLVFRNAIGTNAARSLSDTGLGNAGHGVLLLNTGRNEVGRVFEQQGNTIAFNGGSGVSVQASTALGPPYVSGIADGNVISDNTIVSNRGPGIDLGGDGLLTPNDLLDPDSGPNALQNVPILLSATYWPGAGASVEYALNSHPAQAFRLEFFSGGVYFMTVNVTTDAEGNVSGVARIPGVLGAAITATATEVSTGNTSEFSSAVSPATTPVVAGWFFYNNSAYDFYNPAANSGDDRAVAPDKYPSVSRDRPATNAVPANYTTYDKGVNGIMLDVVGALSAGPLTEADFQFVVEQTVRREGRLVTQTRPAPPPSAITVRPRAGLVGTDRVTITWPDGAIRNAWLRVTFLRPDPAQPVSLSFGNLAGNSAGWGFPSGPGARMYVKVDAMDLAAMKSRLTGATADLANRYDHNRDGRVDLLDFATARANLGAALRMYWFPGV